MIYKLGNKCPSYTGKYVINYWPKVINQWLVQQHKRTLGYYKINVKGNQVITGRKQICPLSRT